MATRRAKVLQLFQPNDSGESEWVSIDRFAPAGLRWSDNGNLRRGAPWGLNEYLWEAERIANKVTALRMTGINESESFDQAINSDIRSALESSLECNLSMIPVPKQDREIDHRYGFKSHPDYVELYKRENQSVSDFQLIHRVLNLQKRQMCKNCVESGKRPAHPTLGYAEGDESLNNSNPCRGCYLAEPERFRGLSPT
jgi:hypothetical protein